MIRVAPCTNPTAAPLCRGCGKVGAELVLTFHVDFPVSYGGTMRKAIALCVQCVGDTGERCLTAARANRNAA